MGQPRYPNLRVSIRSPNPLALVAATRDVLRRSGAASDDIEGFTAAALADPDDRQRVLEVTREWVGAVSQVPDSLVLGERR